MIENLLGYPLVGIIFWCINWLLERLGILNTLVPLRLWIVSGFTIAWIPYVVQKSMGSFWLFTIAFMFGGPFAIYWMLFEFPRIDDANCDPDTQTTDSHTDKTPSGDTPQTKNNVDLSASDYVKMLLLLLIIAGSVSTCIKDRFVE